MITRRSVCLGLLALCLSSAVMSSAVTAEADLPRYPAEVQHARPDATQRARSEELLTQPAKAEVRVSLPTAPFHQRQTSPANETSLCLACHRDMPHARSATTRSFLNQHTRLLGCESCHLPATADTTLRWVNLQTGEVVDKPKSTPGDIRILPVEQERPATLSRQSPWAQQWLDQWERKIDTASRVTLHSQLHQPLRSLPDPLAQTKDEAGKPSVPTCVSCHHRQQTYLDYRALGYEEAGIQRLQTHPIPQFIGQIKAEEGIQLRDLLP